MKRIVFLLLFLGLFVGLNANNVRIVKDVSVDATTFKDGKIDLNFTIAWNNSWRDDFNWDAVYIFMKYKKTSATEWSHALFTDNYHTLSLGYEYWMGKNNITADQCQGIFIFNDAKKSGDAEVEATLKWNVGAAGLTQNDFVENIVEMSLMAIEMVYVPKGAFYLGDGISTGTFKTTYRHILPEWDLIKNDGTQKYTATSTVAGYGPEKAANRVNEGRDNWFNSWQANTGVSLWQVEFPEAKQVRFFGVSGVRGRTNNRPASWIFEGSANGVDNWKALTKTLSAADWTVDNDSYPIRNAIKVTQNMGAYRFYRIRIITASYTVLLNNIAMTEKDMDQVNDNGFVVDEQNNTAIPLNLTTGLCADDGDTWSGTLNANYPTGFEGFYAMKYEISQEQYIRFLNKLTPAQQVQRTRGDLELLESGEYIFGSNKSTPNHRNGIIVGTRVNGSVIFANNLNKANNFSQDDDGQTLACNYLSVNDMLAYADWTGLRPLSEMEYEKMARRPYPSAPGLKDWAGGKEASLILPAGENYSSGSAGRFDERLINANINAGGKTSGPVRVGSFAKGASNPTEAGASYWGLMDLSGNLAEIYYNVNTYGRIFSDDVRGRNHGDGYLDATGMNNVAIGYWPIAQVGAFGLRGGSFMSEKAGESEGEVSVADRSKMRCFSSLDSRDSTVSFRLGHSCTKLIEQYPASYSSYIQLENGKMSTSTNQFDSVCVNTLYTIKGSELLDASSNPITFSGKIQYIWYMSEVSASAGWRIIPGANNRDLTYSDWRDESNTVREVWIKRVIMTPIGAHTTNHVILRIVNDHFSINRLVDTIKDNNQVLAFSARTALPATYTWRWKSAEPGSPALQTNPLTTHSYYFSKREDFNNISKQNHVVQCQIKVLNKCVKNVEVKVYVEPRLEVGIASSDIVMNGTNPKKECGVMMQDTRDGKVYGTVRIGDQCWMAENLRYELIGNIQYQAGDPSGEKYGIMYVSNAVVYNNACPAGWRMALNTDFETLRTYLKDGKNTEGLKLRAGNYWAMAGQADANFGTNTSGFGAVGAGHNNASAGLHTYAYFITSNGNYYSVHYANQAFSGPTGTSGSHYMSIRCIKR